MDWSDHGTGTEGLTAAVTKLENGVLARTRKLETLDRALMRLLPRRVAAAMEVGVQDCYLNGCASAFTSDYSVRMFPYYITVDGDGTVTASTASLAGAAEASRAASRGGDRV
jgi:hypothetical protein